MTHSSLVNSFSCNVFNHNVAPICPMLHILTARIKDLRAPLIWIRYLIRIQGKTYQFLSSVQGRSQFPLRGLYAPDHLVCVIYHSKYSFYRNLSFTKNVCLAKLVSVCTPNFTSRGVASTPLKNLTPLK